MIGTAEPPPLWSVRVLTLFPEMFPGPLSVSLAGRAGLVVGNGGHPRVCAR